MKRRGSCSQSMLYLAGGVGVTGTADLHLQSRGQLTFTSTLCTPEEREPESAIPASELDRGGAGKTSNSVKDVLDAAAVQTNAI